MCMAYVWVYYVSGTTCETTESQYNLDNGAIPLNSIQED
jgi:hypothetical protein